MKVSIIGGTGPQGLGIAERLAIAGVDVCPIWSVWQMKMLQKKVTY